MQIFQMEPLVTVNAVVVKLMMKGCSKGEFRNCNDACKYGCTRDRDCDDYDVGHEYCDGYLYGTSDGSCKSFSGYTRYDDTTCTGWTIDGVYFKDTLKEAVIACNEDRRCGCIYFD